MSEAGKIVHHHHHSAHHFPPPPPPPQQPPSMAQYGTFEGIPPSTPPETGFGRVVHHHHHRRDDSNLFPPPDMFFPPPPPPPAGARFSPSRYFARGYQTVPGYVQGIPVRESRLPCCGLGLVGILFIIFFIIVVGICIWVILS